MCGWNWRKDVNHYLITNQGPMTVESYQGSEYCQNPRLPHSVTPMTWQEYWENIEIAKNRKGKKAKELPSYSKDADDDSTCIIWHTGLYREDMLGVRKTWVTCYQAQRSFNYYVYQRVMQLKCHCKKIYLMMNHWNLFVPIVLVLQIALMKINGSFTTDFV